RSETSTRDEMRSCAIAAVAAISEIRVVTAAMLLTLFMAMLLLNCRSRSGPWVGSGRAGARCCTAAARAQLKRCAIGPVGADGTCNLHERERLCGLVI